jgi:hypothetical protein
MPAAQQDFVSKYYWARQGEGDALQQQGTTNNKSVRQMMRAAMKRARVPRAMTMVMRMTGDKEGKGDGNKGGGRQRGRRWQGNGDGNKGGGQATATVRKRAMATVMVTRVAGEQQERQQRGQW